jgi:hypothetical protein
VALIKTSWTGKSPPTDVAFAAKVALPAGAKVSIFGDIHGALNALFQEMQLIQNKNQHIGDDLRMVGNNAIIFCGDLLDRGTHSIEVFAFVLLLRMANPGRVFVARGNHECGAAASKPSRAFCSTRPARPLAPFSPPPLFRRGSSEADAKQLWGNWGLIGMQRNEYTVNPGELTRKFGLSMSKAFEALGKDIFRATATLPAAIFFSVAGSTEDARWALASHGGFEPSGSVKAFLSTAMPSAPENAAAYAAFGANNGPTVFARKSWHTKVHSADFRGNGAYHDTKGRDTQGPDTVGEFKWNDNVRNQLQYQWADIADDDNEFFDGKSCADYGRCGLGKLLILEWMRENNVITLFRGHQHNGLSMKGANECVVLSPR